MKNIFILTILMFTFSLEADTIVRTDQKKDRPNPFGEIIILKETYQYLIYRFKNDYSEQKMPWDDIKEYRYNETCAIYDIAQEKFNKKDYNEAIKNYKEAINSGVKWVKQHCMFKTAECYKALGEYSKAIEYYTQLNREFRDGLYYPNALINTGHCYLSLNQLEKARSAFGEAKDKCESLNIKKWVMEARFWQSFLYEKTKSYSTAISKYQGVIEEAGDKFPEFTTRALIGKARCYLELNRSSDAQSIYLELIKNICSKSDDLEKSDKDKLGSIYLGLGDCYFKDKDLESAIYCYLRVILVYRQDDEEEVAKAYYNAALCFSLLKNSDSRSQAAALYNELLSTYPRSTWASQPPKW